MGNASNFNNHEVEWYEGNLKKNKAKAKKNKKKKRVRQAFVTLQSHGRHKNLDTYSYILETWGRWHMNPHCQSFLGMYDTCAKT